MSPSQRSCHILPLGQRKLELGRRTAIMGVLNVTPDSFSDGGIFLDRRRALDRAMEMVEEGADIIDVGGQSTRPGSAPVGGDEELARVVPVVEEIRSRCAIPMSIDTSKARVAQEALAAGAGMVNDITALREDPRMIEVVIQTGAAVCLMHMQGDPQTMQKAPHYADVVSEVRRFLQDRAQWAVSSGVPEDRILVDPGIGFGKSLQHNLALLASAGAMGAGRFAVLVGPSRKSFIGLLLNLPVTDRLEGTLGATVATVLCGAHMVRVHDVKPVVRALRVADEIVNSVGGGWRLEAGG